jgi:hypothetical protein
LFQLKARSDGGITSDSKVEILEKMEQKWESVVAADIPSIATRNRKK